MKLLSKIMIAAAACTGSAQVMMGAQNAKIQKFVAYKANKTDYPQNSVILVRQNNDLISKATFKESTNEQGVKFENKDPSIHSLYYEKNTPFTIEFRPEQWTTIEGKKMVGASEIEKWFKANTILSKIKITKTALTPEYDKLPKPTLKSVDVYKESPDQQKWTVMALPTEPYRTTGFLGEIQDKPFGATQFVQDTTGLRTKKLKFPSNQDWELFVYKEVVTEPRKSPAKQRVFTKGEVKYDSILILDRDGNARVAAKSEKPKYDK